MSFINKKLEDFREQFKYFEFTTIDDEFNHRSDHDSYDIEDFLSTALDEMINEVDTNISRLLQKVADSPLDKRLNGWDALLEVRKSLSSLREGNK